MGKLRIQVNLPEDLVRRIDALVGPRKRREFIEQAVLRELRLEALRCAPGTEPQKAWL